MEWVVRPFGVQADLDIIVLASELPEDLSDLVTEVPFDFEHECAGLGFRICGSIAQQLVGERIHAATGFPAANRADDDGTGEQATLRDDQPAGFLCRYGEQWIVNLSDDKAQASA